MIEDPGPIRRIIQRIRKEERLFGSLKSGDLGFAQSRDRLSGLRGELKRLLNNGARFIFRKAIVQRFLILHISQDLTGNTFEVCRGLMPGMGEFQKIVAEAILPASVLTPSTTWKSFPTAEGAIHFYESMLADIPAHIEVEHILNLEPLDL